MTFELAFRLCYVSGQDGLMLKSLSYVHYKKMTPSPAVVLQGIITFLFILTKDVTELIQFVGFLKMIFYSLSMISLLILKRRMKDASRLYKVPFILPICMLLIFLFLFFTPIVINPTAKYLVAIGLVGVGIVVYYLFIYKDILPDAFLVSEVKEVKSPCTFYALAGLDFRLKINYNVKYTLQYEVIDAGLNDYIQILLEAIPSHSIEEKEVGVEEIVNRP